MIPAEPMETDKLWGYVLDKRSKEDHITVVIDELIIINRNPAYQAHMTVQIPIQSITHRIPRDPDEPTLLIVVESGSLMDIVRIDGKTTPIKVSVNEDSRSETLIVDHTGYRRSV